MDYYNRKKQFAESRLAKLSRMSRKNIKMRQLSQRMKMKKRGVEARSRTTTRRKSRVPASMAMNENVVLRRSTRIKKVPARYAANTIVKVSAPKTTTRKRRGRSAAAAAAVAPVAAVPVAAAPTSIYENYGNMENDLNITNLLKKMNMK